MNSYDKTKDQAENSAKEYQRVVAVRCLCPTPKEERKCDCSFYDDGTPKYCGQPPAEDKKYKCDCGHAMGVTYYHSPRCNIYFHASIVAMQAEDKKCQYCESSPCVCHVCPHGASEGECPVINCANERNNS